jgi:Sigma-54 interaction domain
MERASPAPPPLDDEPALGAFSSAMHGLIDLARKVARVDSNILITGESGVGKECLAQFIRRASARAAGPFTHCAMTRPVRMYQVKYFARFLAILADGDREIGTKGIVARFDLERTEPVLDEGQNGEREEYDDDGGCAKPFHLQSDDRRRQ